MSVTERVKIARLILKINTNAEYAHQLGLGVYVYSDKNPNKEEKK
jgi:hypothetical protein